MSKQPYKSVVSGEKVSDLEKLLDLAEDLKDKYEAKNRDIEKYRLLQLSTLGLSIVFIGWIIIKRDFLQSELMSTLTFLFTSVCVIYLIALEYLVRRAQIQIKPDAIALSEIIHLIRETEGALAKTENWSALERAQFRIRLSRFKIGYIN